LSTIGNPDFAHRKYCRNASIGAAVLFVRES